MCLGKKWREEKRGLVMRVRLMVRKRSWGAWEDLGVMEVDLARVLAQGYEMDGWKVLWRPAVLAA